MLLRIMSFLQGLISWLGSIFADSDSPYESNSRRNPNSSAMEGSAPDTSVVNERVVHLPVSRVNERFAYKLKGYFDLAKEEMNKAVRAKKGRLIDDAISHYRNAQLILEEGASTRAPSYITPSKQQKVKYYHREMTKWQYKVAKRLQSLSQQRGVTIPDKVCTGLTEVQITRSPPQAAWGSQRPSNSAKNDVSRKPSFGGNRSGTKAHTGTTGASKSNHDSDCHDTKLVEMINTVIVDRSPSVKWDAVAGLDKAKETLFEMAILPTKRRDLFTGLRRSPRGLLLFGPPGNGKTMLAKAVASECDATFFNVSASSLTSKWVGEGEKLVRTLFMVAISRQPSVIFMDEIDSILSTRVANEHDASRRLKSEFLVQFDGVTSNRDDLVVVIGATNKPQELDDAVLRRLVKRIYVPLPDQNVRRLFLQQNLKGERNQIKGGDLKRLARETEGYSGSDLQALCEEAAMMPIREHGSNALTVGPNEVRPLRKDDFRRAMTAIRTSLQKSKWEELERWNEEFGSLCRVERWNDFRSVSDPISTALVTSKCWVSRASRTAIPFSIINYFFLYIFVLCTVYSTTYYFK